MTGLDLREAALAERPLRPVDRDSLTPEVLAGTARRILARTERMDLHQWFWGEGVALLGAVRLADALGEPIPQFVGEFVDRHLRAGVQLDHVNAVIPGALCARLYAETGSAWYANACQYLVSWLAERAAPGIIEHWPGGVWADTAYMAGVFLVHCGRYLGRPELIEAAARQLVLHAEMLRDPGTGLYAHGSHHGRTIRCYWGRANAWTALAGVELLEVSQDERVAELVRTQLLGLARAQPEHGVWDVLVDGQPETRGIVETSAAAGIAAAMFRAARLGLESERLLDSAWRAVAGLHAYVAADGTLTRTSAGTVLQLVPFGYSVIRNDRIQPWGQGLALHAYAEALHTP
ncbi:rhamnogalacturonyl hydrolase YesR [Kutzneria viridogrisea]|uniref:Unsaturated rhamnogalacturonyl hydrolase n=1 Tax=Kutzneria viridogrisea TaxID=47990 RepID=A0ABR6BIH1_9PSEU|nr:unsaturated rhamnogalacturonyl hydrolase [Kutzneria viridogrisea]